MCWSGWVGGTPEGAPPPSPKLGPQPPHCMHPLLFGRAADSVLPRPVLLSDTGNLAIISLAATQGRSSCCPAGLPGFRGRRPAHHSQAAEPQPRAPSTPQGQEVAHTGGTHTAVEPMGQEARGPSSTLADEEWAGAGGGHSSSAWGPRRSLPAPPPRTKDDSGPGSNWPGGA